MERKVRIAILDDYQNIALKYADWSAISAQAEVIVFNEHLQQDQLTDALKSFDVLCIMRERTPLNYETLKQLPDLKLIVSTAKRNASLDTRACEELGIKVAMTEYVESGAPELTWALLMAIARHIPTETQNIRSGNWQTTVGTDLKGKTLGIVGLGRIGSKIAQYARAFEMKVIAWSENLIEENAHRAGAEPVSKARLFKEADFVTVHLVLSDRSRGVIGAPELNAMKPTAYLVNTSRAPLIDEQALLTVLQNKQIAGAALDVYDTEPLPKDHPLRRLDNVLATPHIGYVTKDTYRVFYSDTVNHIERWLADQSTNTES